MWPKTVKQIELTFDGECGYSRGDTQWVISLEDDFSGVILVHLCNDEDGGAVFKLFDLVLMRLLDLCALFQPPYAWLGDTYCLCFQSNNNTRVNAYSSNSGAQSCIHIIQITSCCPPLYLSFHSRRPAPALYLPTIKYWIFFSKIKVL